MIAEYRIFGGIDANRIIPLIPLFDACTIDFWRYVWNYGFLNRVRLSNDMFNSKISVALKTMFWYNSFFRESGWAENNGTTIL